MVTPVGPTRVDPVCRGGVLQAPTLTLAETDGITYTAAPEPPYAMFQNVTVTATLDDADAVWPDPLPAGWTATSDPAVVTWGVFFGYGACTPVSPANPEIHLASCAAGVVTVPTVVAASGPTGVSYVVEPAGALTPGTATHTVTVTATVADGYSWGQLGAGWLPGATEASKVLTVHLAWRVV